MITNVLITIIYYFLYSVIYPIRLLPDVSLPSSITSSITTAGSYFYIFDPILPLSTVFTIITLFLTIEGFIVAYKLIMWVIRKIPGIN